MIVENLDCVEMLLLFCQSCLLSQNFVMFVCNNVMRTMRPRLFRDELKKIDEQTGGQKGKGNNRSLSAEEKQIQV